uniref:Uncharacterized protein LOC104249014 n=1 Tax=Nicotiana sylvestris TaxID=4096 RepID=A0A1U7YWX7_NICSY|nr:PREDICTED: uncharacterized protein LOC104249014 [Nicotiana sylvestris]
MVDDGSGACIVHPRVLTQMKLEDRIVSRCIMLTGFNIAVERISGKITARLGWRHHLGDHFPHHGSGYVVQHYHRLTMDTRHARNPKENSNSQVERQPILSPVRQIRRKFNSVINDAVREEVEKLLVNSSIRESKYPQWVANVVMLKKKNGKWSMCVDFTNLNKACPKDSFPLPHIDHLIDAIAEHELLSFLDVYSGYNQILMEEEDQEKTTFITHQGTYCYKVMSFGLKYGGQCTRGW